LIVLIAGCSGSAVKTVPAKGTIKTSQGEACANAIIVFHPLEKNRLSDPKPVATADETGAFVVRTFTMEDGAVPGEYSVTVVWPGQQQEAQFSITGEGKTAGLDRLLGKYGNPSQPLIKITIPASGDQNISLQVEAL
jgi:hypothetical protein